MAEYSTRKKISSNEGYLRVLPKKKPKPEPEENKFMFRVLLLNGLNLNLQLEDAVEKMSIVEFVRTVGRKADPLGPQVYVEDAMGGRIEDGNIICNDPHNKPMMVALWDAILSHIEIGTSYAYKLVFLCARFVSTTL